MTRPTIAYFDIPYHSRLVTTLPVVRALVDRGHRVHAFTLDAYRGLVESAGATFVAQPSFGPKVPDCTVNLRGIDYAEEAAPAIAAELRRLRPDLVVFTAKCLWAAAAAERCGLPTAVIHTNALWPRGEPVSPAVFAARWPGKSEPALAAIEARDRAAWARCRARLELRKIHDDDVLPGLPNCMNLRGDLNLVYTSDLLQPRRADFDDDIFKFVGPCYDDRPADHDPALEAALASLPSPRIYGSLGSMRLYNDRGDVFRTVLDALAPGPYGGVLSLGDDAAVAELGPAPAHVLVRAYVPQLAVLRAAALFLNHAGTNSVFESLLAGVPMLMLPQGGDQPIFAEHMHALGLGVWLRDDELAPAPLRARFAALLADDALRGRVRAAGEDLRRAGGTPRAAELLSAFAAGVTPAR